MVGDVKKIAKRQLRSYTVSVVLLLVSTFDVYTRVSEQIVLVE